MTELFATPPKRSHMPWRVMGWGGAVALLAIPFLANFPWTGSDYAFAAIIFVIAGLGFELAVRVTHDRFYRAAAALTILACFLLVWLNLAVGIIGSEDHPANLMYLADLCTCVLGAMLVRGRAAGMAVVLTVAAAAQSVLTVIVLVERLGATEPPGSTFTLVLNLIFVAIFAVAAWLFRRAAKA